MCVSVQKREVIWTAGKRQVHIGIPSAFPQLSSLMNGKRSFSGRDRSHTHPDSLAYTAWLWTMASYFSRIVPDLYIHTVIGPSTCTHARCTKSVIHLSGHVHAELVRWKTLVKSFPSTLTSSLAFWNHSPSPNWNCSFCIVTSDVLCTWVWVTLVV